jgi:hypothetical protein
MLRYRAPVNTSMLFMHMHIFHFVGIICGFVVILEGYLNDLLGYKEVVHYVK